MVAVAALIAVSIVGQAARRALPEFLARDTLAKLVYVDAEQSLPTLFQVLMLLGAALLFAWIARVDHRDARRAWALVAVVFTLLGVDEFASLHEKATPVIRRALDVDSGLLWFAWVIPGALVVLVIGAASVSFLRRVDPATRRLLLIAGALYVAGALGVELLGGAYASSDSKESWIYVAIATAEEALEMLGALVAVYASLDRMERMRPRADLDVRFRAG
jgi:hypothetical protein